MYENQGSNALREYVYEAPAKKRTAEQKKPGLTSKQKLKIFGCIVMLSFLAFIVLMRMAKLNTQYRTLSAQKQVLSELEAKVEQLSSETEGKASPAVTEEQAAEMGLYKAASDQIVYISLDNADKGEVLKEDSSNSGIHAFFNKVGAIAEYFY